MTTSHINEGDLAAYLDRRLSGEARARVEIHLADCAECRAEMAEVSRLLRRDRPRWAVIAPAAAAAAVAAILLLPGFPGRSEDGEPLVRSGSEDLPSVAAVLPVPDARVGGRRLTFTWRSTVPEAAYRIAVTTEVGDLVWSATLRDTTATLPDSVRLVPGRGYGWYVDALHPDGSSATSGVREFRVTP